MASVSGAQLNFFAPNHQVVNLILSNGQVVTGATVAGTIDVALSDAELAERRRAWTPRKNGYQSGTLWKYVQTVGDTEKGAVTHPGAHAETHVYADL